MGQKMNLQEENESEDFSLFSCSAFLGCLYKILLFEVSQHI